MPEVVGSKRLLVSGASSGIGAASALMRAEAGAQVLATSGNAEKEDALAALRAARAAGQPAEVAVAIHGAVTARPRVCADVIDLHPVGQP